jgi:hypothetical protein
MAKKQLYEEADVTSPLHTVLGPALAKAIEDATKCVGKEGIHEDNVRFLIGNRLVFEGLKVLRDWRRTLPPHLTSHRTEEDWLLASTKSFIEWLDGVPEPTAADSAILHGEGG